MEPANETCGEESLTIMPDSDADYKTTPPPPRDRREAMLGPQTVCCCLGERNPWRLTKDSGYRLMLAIVETRAAVISAMRDTTCPPIHADIRVEIPVGKRAEFERILGTRLETVEQAGGSQ